MAKALVRSDFSGPVARLRLDSPSNRNALSQKMLAELAAAVERASSDPAIRVLVLGHTGPTFCAGADLREQAAAIKGGGQAKGVGMLAPLLQLILDCPKPVVCLVGGPARAGGLGLVAACDIAIASESATFAASEVRLGLAPAVLAVVVLPKIGRSAAARLFLTGEAVPAQQALAMGLVSEVVPDPELESALERVLDQLLLGNPKALAAAKRIIRDVPGLDRGQAFASMVELSGQLFSSPEAAEGMNAFLEHRPAGWAVAGERG